MHTTPLTSRIVFRLLIALLFTGAFSLSSLANIQPRIVGGIESEEGAWPHMSALMYKSLGISVNDESYPAFFLAQSPTRLFGGTLADCGKAFVTCEGVEDKICLIERGETFFSEKVQSCEDGGGIGAIIYNNEEGIFFGTLGRTSSGIPAVSTTQAAGLDLLNHLGEEVAFGFTTEVPNVSFCGASYLGGKWLVTAAHCVNDIDPETFFVNVGGLDLETDVNNVINVARIIVHEAYDPKLLDNDIALLELTEEPQGASPILLADKTMLSAATAANETVVELGRGQQAAVAPFENPLPSLTPSQLYQVEVNLVSNQTCNRAFNEFSSGTDMSVMDLITDDMVCAGTEEGDTGTCFGDSGGPLVLQQDGADYLIGITSWGLGCAVPGLYDVFTRVPSYKAAIERVTSGQSGRLTLEESDDDDERFFGALSFNWLFVFVVLAIYRFGCKKTLRYA